MLRLFKECFMKRKLAGFSKSGKVWVNSALPNAVQARVRRHQKTFQKARLNGASTSEALRLARKAEHKGLGKKQILSYEGHVGALTKDLHGRMSYSPLRGNKK